MPCPPPSASAPLKAAGEAWSAPLQLLFAQLAAQHRIELAIEGAFPSSPSPSPTSALALEPVVRVIAAGEQGTHLVALSATASDLGSLHDVHVRCRAPRFVTGLPTLGAVFSGTDLSSGIAEASLALRTAWAGSDPATHRRHLDLAAVASAALNGAAGGGNSNAIGRGASGGDGPPPQLRWTPSMLGLGGITASGSTGPVGLAGDSPALLTVPSPVAHERLRALVRAVAELHAAGFAHGNLSPGTVTFPVPAPADFASREARHARVLLAPLATDCPAGSEFRRGRPLTQQSSPSLDVASRPGTLRGSVASLHHLGVRPVISGLQFATPVGDVVATPGARAPRPLASAIQLSASAAHAILLPKPDPVFAAPELQYSRESGGAGAEATLRLCPTQAADVWSVGMIAYYLAFVAPAAAVRRGAYAPLFSDGYTSSSSSSSSSSSPSASSVGGSGLAAVVGAQGPRLLPLALGDESKGGPDAEAAPSSASSSSASAGDAAALAAASIDAAALSSAALEAASGAGRSPYAWIDLPPEPLAPWPPRIDHGSGTVSLPSLDAVMRSAAFCDVSATTVIALLAFIRSCLAVDPDQRATAQQLLSSDLVSPRLLSDTPTFGAHTAQLEAASHRGMGRLQARELSAILSLSSGAQYSSPLLDQDGAYLYQQLKQLVPEALSVVFEAGLETTDRHDASAAAWAGGLKIVVKAMSDLQAARFQRARASLAGGGGGGSGLRRFRPGSGGGGGDDDGNDVDPSLVMADMIARGQAVEFRVKRAECLVPVLQKMESVHENNIFAQFTVRYSLTSCISFRCRVAPFFPCLEPELHFSNHPLTHSPCPLPILAPPRPSTRTTRRASPRTTAGSRETSSPRFSAASQRPRQSSSSPPTARAARCCRSPRPTHSRASRIRGTSAMCGAWESS